MTTCKSPQYAAKHPEICGVSSTTTSTTVVPPSTTKAPTPSTAPSTAPETTVAETTPSTIALAAAPPARATTSTTAQPSHPTIPEVGYNLVGPAGITGAALLVAGTIAVCKARFSTRRA